MDSAAHPPLRRQLGLTAVAAVVVGDMLGSGVFFTPGELAAVAQAPWQVYLFWGLAGLITLCGALTLAELTCLLPRAGASYHIIREGFGPFWAFLKIWIEMWVSGPGSVAGVAIAFGEFAVRLLEGRAAVSATTWGAVAILAFTAVNLQGVRCGGRTQIALTAVKLLGALALIGGSLLLAAPVAPSEREASAAAGADLLGFVRVVGLGLAAVLFTYDGWVDVTHVAGEVKEPRRNLPAGLGLGVLGITLLYLLVNFAYLRVVTLEAMRAAPATVAATAAVAAFGPEGGRILNALIMVSILGALGGLVMTLPRLYFAGASEYDAPTRGSRLNIFFSALSRVSAKGVPAGSALFSAALAVTALLSFGTFRRIVTFFVVPVHFVNILMVASVFRLRRRSASAEAPYLTPGYPWVPAIYILVLALFLVSAILYNPVDTLIGVAMTATGIPVYLSLRRGRP
ncbi:MAG TPA: amino acid permease [Vicinamibacteria bacterium]|nr:amino acid permease [Vicinamibacteria bacterium]